jgi:hypothetical protein
MRQIDLAHVKAFFRVKFLYDYGLCIPSFAGVFDDGWCTFYRYVFRTFAAPFVKLLFPPKAWSLEKISGAEFVGRILSCSSC